MDDKQRKRAEITFSVGEAEALDGGGAAFSGVAYSGRAIEQWGQKFAVDLSDFPDGDGVEIPVLLDHRNSIDAIAGRGRVFRAQAEDGGDELRIEGRLTGATEAGERVATLMSDGFPLRMSIGFRAAFREVEDETEVNGRKMALDGVFERPQLQEVSFVAVPADPNAGVSEVLMCADPGAGSDDAPPELTDRIARLEADLEAAEERARAAEEALSALRRETREKALSEAMAALGRDMPEGIEPWFEMSDEAFSAAIGALREAAGRTGRLDEGLFSAASLSRAGGDDGRAPAERLMAAVERIIGN